MPTILLLLGLGLTASSEEFPQSLRDKAAAATVKVVNVADEAQGSGVIIHHQGSQIHVLTANHVISRAKTVEVHVVTSKGETKIYRSVRVLAGNEQSDLAIIRLISSDGFPDLLPICPRGKGPRGRTFSAISSGWVNKKNTVQVEKVKSKVLLRRPGEKESVWSYETVRKPVQGRSGGPLVDAEGRILGIASGHDSEAGYFTHFDEIHSFLRMNGLQWLIETDD